MVVVAVPYTFLARTAMMGGDTAVDNFPVLRSNNIDQTENLMSEVLALYCW